MKIFGVIIVTLALVYSVASYSIIEGKTISPVIAKTTWFPSTVEKPKKPIFDDYFKDKGNGELAKVDSRYVKDLIELWANRFKADSQKMLKIAQCESELNPRARNQKSTASGVFQFVKQTWMEKCDGNVFDASDNVRCAAELIASGELSHWEESKTCWNK